jgi:hypothetical protein
VPIPMSPEISSKTYETHTPKCHAERSGIVRRTISRSRSIPTSVPGAGFHHTHNSQRCGHRGAKDALRSRLRKGRALVKIETTRERLRRSRLRKKKQRRGILS